MNREGIFYTNYDTTRNNAPNQWYGQDVVDGYKRMLKESTEENTKLRQENIKLLNQVRQLRRVKNEPAFT